MKTIKALAWVMLVGAPLFLSFGYVREALLVDSCLDSGGSFDYFRMICDREVGHIYIPFIQRHGTLIVATSLSMFIAGSYLIISGMSRRRSG